MNKYYNYIWVLIIGIFLGLYIGCKNNHKILVVKDNKIHVLTSYKTKIKEDTLVSNRFIYKWKHDTLTLIDTVTKEKTIIISGQKVSVRDIQNKYEDTNIVIYTNDTIAGKLINQGINYKLKIPVKVIVNKQNRAILIGIDLYSDDGIHPNCFLNLSYQNKLGNILSGGYDPVNKLYEVGFKYKIRLK
mgnify:CR=1 FL=1